MNKSAPFPLFVEEIPIPLCAVHAGNDSFLEAFRPRRRPNPGRTRVDLEAQTFGGWGYGKKLQGPGSGYSTCCFCGHPTPENND